MDADAFASAMAADATTVFLTLGPVSPSVIAASWQAAVDRDKAPQVAAAFVKCKQNNRRRVRRAQNKMMPLSLTDVWVRQPCVA
eukprot:9496933-Pyramimonas_sp.AAC.1